MGSQWLWGGVGWMGGFQRGGPCQWNEGTKGDTRERPGI